MIDRFGEAMKATRDTGLDVRVGPARAWSWVSTPHRRRWPRSSAPAAADDPARDRRAAARPDRRPRGSRLCRGKGAARRAGRGRARRLPRRRPCGWPVAMLRARDALLAGQAQLCLVGGVDSYLDPETLEWLDDNEQLHSEGNIYGFCPGEARRLLPARHPRQARALRLPAAARTLSPSPRRARKSDQDRDRLPRHRPRRRLPPGLRGSPGAIGPVDRIICDMNGERYRGNEYGFAVLRNSRPLPRRRRLRDPGRLLGRPRRGLRPALRRPCHRGRSARLFAGAAVA